MKIARFEQGGRVAYGEIRDGEIAEIEGDVFDRFSVTSRRHVLSQVRLLPPTSPKTCMAVGYGYEDHLAFASEVFGRPVRLPRRPQPWRKGESCICGDGSPIVIPADSNGNVQYEGELVVVIGRKCRRATESTAMDFVFGYTCGNDVSERDWQRTDRHFEYETVNEAEWEPRDFNFWRSKGSDTFAPVGPWIATDVDPYDLDLEVRLNGKVVQKSHTSKLVYRISTLIETLTQAITLFPGDLIFTGTPGSPAAMRPGDVVEVELSRIGVLRNPVVAGI